MGEIPLKHLSSLPVVDLLDISEPVSGLSSDVPTQCIKNFAKSNECRLHYQQLLSNPAAIGEFTQCPHGFSTYVHSSSRSLLALTSFIPWPRMEGEAERRLAKSNKDCKVARESVVRMSNALQKTEEYLARLEKDTIQRNSLSLHEARKFNRTIKQTAERLCRRNSPDNPNQAKPEFVKIWKAAEMMSTQFEILELIANETLTQLPINSTVEFFPLAHKVVHLYSDRRPDVHISIRGEPKGFVGQYERATKLSTLFRQFSSTTRLNTLRKILQLMYAFERMQGIVAWKLRTIIIMLIPLLTTYLKEVSVPQHWMELGSAFI